MPSGSVRISNWDKVFPSEHEHPPADSSTTSPASSTPAPPPPAGNVDRFVGLWTNENPDTDGITRVEIDRRLNTLSVHMWGKCHPADCDWGTQQTDVSDSDDGVLFITWTPGFSLTSQQVTALPDGRLRVVGHTRFTDNSGRPEYDSTHYFRRR